jgi:nucleotide-binding universal stress UspA family protein
MKNILVPVDFSNCSISALEFAAFIAKKAGSRLTMFNVVYDPSQKSYSPDLRSALSAEGSDKQKLYLKLKANSLKAFDNLKSQQYMQGLKITTKVTSGSGVYSNILDYSEKSNTDLIVMGTNGANKLTERIIGTNAERIVRFTTTPVMVVGRKVSKSKIENIVFPTDLSAKASKVFKYVKYFADLFGANVHILRVNLKGDFLRTSYAMGRMGLLIKNQKGNYSTEIVDAKSIEQGIIDYSKKVKADIIAIGAHQRKGPARYFTDRITESILRLSDLPILTINLPK